jgi:23S rRNA (adenine2503-C2)-methyltransferase
VGLVPAIRRFADEKRQTRLAISLHAASDDDRNKLIPAGRRWPIAELMEAARYYILQTGRRITFEWALINMQNDNLEDARKLGGLLTGMLCHVNLIPLNPTKDYGGQPSPRSRVTIFQKELERFGVSSTVRVRRGLDIQAGCGQLRDRVVRGSS